MKNINTRLSNKDIIAQLKAENPTLEIKLVETLLNRNNLITGVVVVTTKGTEVPTTNSWNRR